MFNCLKMKNYFPNPFQIWGRLDIHKTGSREANLIPSVHIDKVMDSYISDGVQRVANRKQQGKGTFTGNGNRWSKKNTTNFRNSKRGLPAPRNTEAGASGRSTEALVLVQPAVFNSKRRFNKAIRTENIKTNNPQWTERITRISMSWLWQHNPGRERYWFSSNWQVSLWL